MITRVELKVSKSVNTLVDEFQSYTPPAGSELVIDVFCAEAAFSVASVVKLIWKFGTGSEEVLWSIRGHGIMPFKIRIPPTDTDGVRKIAISCDNGDLTNMLMSGYARVQVNDMQGG